MLPSTMPLREAPFILCKMENVFWSVPSVRTEKFAPKFMVNLGKCHGSVGRKSPKSKPKHAAKCLWVCLTSIWVIALAPWELVLNRRSGTLSLTKKCPKWWPHSQSWLEKNCLSHGQHYNEKGKRNFLGTTTWMPLGLIVPFWQRGHIVSCHCRHEPAWANVAAQECQVKDPGHRPMNILRRTKRSRWMMRSSPACLNHTSRCFLHLFLCQHKVVCNCGLNWFEGTRTGWNSFGKHSSSSKRKTVTFSDSFMLV